MYAHQLRSGDAIALDDQVKIVRVVEIDAGLVVAIFYNGERHTFSRDAIIADTADYNVA